MKTWSEDTPLSRIPNETQKAHDALMDYFLMGAGRSLDKLVRKYTKSAPKPPTIHLTTLKNWSTRNHWQARIAQQNTNDNAMALEEYRQRYIKRYMSKEEVIARFSDQARGDMGTFGNVRTQADLSKHPHSELVRTISQNYNQVTKGEGDEQTTELKARITLGLYDAQKALAKGDALRATGKFKKAVAKYREALEEAERSLT